MKPSDGRQGEWQPSLFTIARPIDEEAERFHEENPHIYEDIKSRALFLRGIGIRRYSIDAIFHAMRWDWLVQTKSTDGYKLNDHFTQWYARKLMNEVPELEGFFSIRRLRSP